MSTLIQVHIFDEDAQEIAVVVMPCCPRAGEMLWLVGPNGEDYGDPGESGDFLGLEVQKVWHLTSHEIDLPLKDGQRPYHRVVVEGRNLSMDDAPMVLDA